MQTYRNGHTVVLCDGCFKPIENFRPKIHNVNRKKLNLPTAHVCSTACVKKIKANPPGQPRCADCGERVATGHPCVCKAQNKPPEVPA